MSGASHKHSQPSSEITALSPGPSLITQVSETPPRNPGPHIRTSSHDLAADSGASPCAIRNPPSSDSGGSPHNPDSTKYYSGGESSEGKTPNWRLRGAYAFAAALLDSTDEEEEEDEREGKENDILPDKDGEKSVVEEVSPRSGIDSLSTLSKGEPSTSTSISPPLHFDSSESMFLRTTYMYHSLISYPHSYTSLCLYCPHTTYSI